MAPRSRALARALALAFLMCAADAAASEASAGAAPRHLQASASAATASLNALFSNLANFAAVGAPVVASSTSANLLTGLAQANALWAPFPIDTRVSFLATCVLTVSTTGSSGANGMSLGVQSDPRGTAAVGANGASYGLYSGLAPWAGLTIDDNLAPFSINAGVVPSAATSSTGLTRTIVGVVSSPLQLTLAYDACLLQMTSSAAGAGYQAYSFNTSLSLQLTLGSASGYLGFTAGSSTLFYSTVISNLAVAIASPNCPAAGTFSYGGCTPTCSSCVPGASLVASSLGCTPASVYSASGALVPVDTAFYLSGSPSEGTGAFAASCSALAGVSFAADRFGALGSATTAGGALSLSSGGYLATPSSSLIMAALPSGTGAASVAAWVQCPALSAGIFASALEWGSAGAASTNLITKFGLVLASTTAPTSFTGTATAPAVLPVCDGSWHHVALAFPGGTSSVSAYVDGGLIGAAPSGESELAFTRTQMQAMGFYLWLDPANAGTVSGATVSQWPNSPYATCTTACTTISPALVNTATTSTPTVGAGNTLPTSIVKPTMSIGASAIPALNNNPAVLFSATTTSVSFINLAPLPSQGTVTATNAASTGQPTLPAAKFPLLVSYVVVFPAGYNPGASGNSGRVLGGSFNNEIMGFWELKTLSIYSDNIGGVAGATTAQGWIPSAGAGAAIVTNQTYLFTLYCDALRNCRVWQNGNLIVTMVASVGWSNQWTLNTPLISCCGWEVSNFYLGDLVMSAGVAFSNYQLGALHQYFNLKYNLRYTNAAAITGLGYYRTDLPPAGGAGGTLRIGTNGLGGDFFTGKIADARVWTRALAAAEVTALFTPPLVFPNAVNPSYSVSATSYSWTCAAGSAGPAATLTYSATTFLWSWTGGVTPNCVQCAPGTYTAAAGATTCAGTVCAAGSVAPIGATSLAAATCVPCGAGSIAATPGLAVCSPCPAGGFANSSGLSSCTSCSAGFYSSIVGLSVAACSPCGLGSYSTAVGASSAATCVPCPAGSASGALGAGLASTCQLCATGSYSAAPGASACTLCGQNTYQAAVGQSSCTACTSGSASSAIGANTPATCVFCSAGSYAVFSGSTSTCVLCGPGSYSAAAGQASCTLCPAGTYSATIGATSAATCLYCAAGTFNPTPGSGTACTPCFANSYSAVTTGASSCTPCPAGTSSAATGAMAVGACTSCAAGTASVSGGSCVPCLPGSFAASQGAASCTLCNVGTSNPSSSATTSSACLSCSAGSFASTAGAATCTACLPGAYAASPGATNCTGSPCPAGYIGTPSATTAAGAACTACPVGMYSSFAGSSSCAPCALGTFATTAGSASCSSALNALYNDLTKYWVVGPTGSTAVASSPTSASLASPVTSSATALWSASPIDTRASFSASFTLGPITSGGADGMSFGVSSGPLGREAVGTTGISAGLYGGTIANWAGLTLVQTSTTGPYSLFAGTYAQAATARSSVGAVASPLAITLAYDACLLKMTVTATGSGYAAYSSSQSLTGGSLFAALGGSSGFIGLTAGSGTTVPSYPLSAYSVNVALPSCLYGAYSYGGCTPTCAPCAAGANFTTSGVCQPSALLSGPTDTAFYLSGSPSEGTNAFAASCSVLSGVGFAADRFGTLGSATTAGGALSLSSGGYLATPSSSPIIATLPAGAVLASASAWVQCLAMAATAWSASMGSFVRGTPATMYFVYIAAPTFKFLVTSCTGPCAAANACATLVNVTDAYIATLTTSTALFNCQVPPTQFASALEWGAQSNYATNGISKFGLVVANANSLTSFTAGTSLNVLPVCDGNWHHAALVRSSTLGALNAYVDGNLIGTSVAAPQSELAFCLGQIQAMSLFLWLDAANAGTVSGASVTAWPNNPTASCTTACTTISPSLVNTATTSAPTVGAGNTLPTSIVKPTMAVGASALPALNNMPAVLFSASTTSVSFINLAQLPSQGTVTATNAASTGQPTTPAIKFPLFISYVVLFPAGYNPGASANSGRILGGTWDNAILGFWEKQAGCLYSDDVGGVAGGATAQGFLNNACASGAIVPGVPYSLTVYCDALRNCRMWVNGNLVMTVVVTVGWSSFLSLNTPLISCCGWEPSIFYMPEFMIQGGVAFTNYQIGVINQYLNLKYNLGYTNAAAITGLGYYRTDLFPAGGAGGTLRIGTNGAGGDAFTGKIADARAWTRALAAAEVAALFTPPLAFPNAVAPAASLTATSYLWTCVAGAFGPAATLVQSSVDLSWSWVAGVQPNCRLCPLGTYATAGATSCSLCPAGSYGGSLGLVSSTCSGICNAGFVCSAGSASASQTPCGSPAVYCPAGSTSPLPVPATNYSTPLAVSGSQRSSFAPCPVGRQCTGGVLFPALDLSASCLAIATTLGGATLLDSTMSSTFSPNLTASVFGMLPPAAVTWGIASIAANNPATCVMSNYQIGLTATSALTAQLSIGSTAINPLLCAAGFVVNVNATRNPVGGLDSTYDSAWGAASTSCSIAVAVVQSLKAPTVVLCAGLSVIERQNVTTKYGTVIDAVPSSPTSTIYYFQNSTTAILNGVVNAALPSPWSVDCNGTLYNTRPVYYSQATSYNVTIRADNVDGYATLSSYCSIVITVLPAPLPPSLTTSQFAIYDLAPLGLFVGNVGAVDNNNVVAGLSYVPLTAWAAGGTDTPNAFAISLAGAITVAIAGTQGGAIDATVKAVYNYVVNVSDALTWTLLPVTINLLASPRPPVVFAQQLLCPDYLLPGAALSPPIAASAQQGKTLTFTLTDVTGTFVVNATTGVVSLSPSAVLNYNNISSYALTATVIDTSAKSAATTITVTIIQSNKPPTFSAPSYALTVNEYAASGSSVGAVFATDSNKNDAVSFAIASCAPLSVGGTACPLAINPLTGAVSVAILPGGVLIYNASSSYAVPWAIVLNVTARDSNLPTPYAVFALATVTIANILPRITTPIALTIPANTSWATAVLSLSSYAYSAYSLSRLSYSISAVLTAEGLPAFGVVGATGVVSVASTPGFNYNTKSVFAFSTTALDTVTGMTSLAAAVTITLQHVNRPPVFNSTLALSTPEKSLGNVGAPLLANVIDPDLFLLTESETVTFLITSGNDGTFGFASTVGGACLAGAVMGVGQLCVLSTASSAFVYTVSPSTVYTLTISVTDAGIDGPRYTATANVTVLIVALTTGPPVFGLPFYNLSVVEHSALGTSVGALVTATSTICTTTCPDSVLSFSLSPAGLNINNPWPFSISTVVALPLSKGQVVVSASPINFSPYQGNGLFATYTGIISVSEARTGVSQPLVSTAPVQINVVWRAEPPFFNPNVVPPATDGGSYVFSFFVNEHSPANTNLTTLPLSEGAPPNGEPFAQALAISKDPWQQPLLQYSMVTASPAFAISSTTAQLMIAPGAPNLQFNTQPSYDVTIKVTDANGLSDTATVTVNIVDVNDPAIFTGFFNAANASMLASNTSFINETAAVGTVVGFAHFYDQDRNPAWSSKNYGLQLSGGAGGLSTTGVPLFAINAATGAITVAGPLMWLDQPRFSLVVTCMDNDMVPLTGTGNVSISLNQANTIVVSSFSSPAGVLAGTAFVAATSYPALAALNDIVFSTLGSSIVLTGQGFGYTANRLLNLPAVVQLVPIVTFGPVSGLEYQLSQCTVSNPGTSITTQQITCLSVPAGLGANLMFVVTSGTFTSLPSARRCSYIPPTISSVSVISGVAGTVPTTVLGASFVVTGNSFGPASVVLYPSGTSNAVMVLHYGQPGAENTYITAPCIVNTPQTTVTCLAVPGAGSELSFQIWVGYNSTSWQAGVQNSSAFLAPGVSYSLPAVASVPGAAASFDTRGGGTFNVSGTNLGPLGTSPIYVSYGLDLVMQTQPVYTSTCVVVVAHTLAACVMVAGTGAGLSVQLTVVNQASAVALSTALAYIAPQLIFNPAKGQAGISSSALTSMPTPGGSVIVLSGNFFGPVLLPNGNASTPSAVYGHPGALRFNTTSCAVSIAHTQITCYTGPGTGAALVWAAVVGGQLSNVMSNVTSSYSPPSIAGYSGPGTSAVTAGGQAVSISGINFGPLGSPVTSVTYGRTGVEYAAANCSLAVPHTLVTCATAPGAGAGLIWFVTIDGQRSIVPSTAYLVPAISSFGLAGVNAGVNVSTDGGDTVVITGTNFATTPFLGAVTYGPGGVGFTAKACSVTVPNTQITCTTVPGTGRALQWVVTVGNQSSAPSTATTSYGLPMLTPSGLLPTSGPTAGGTTIALMGSNFGLKAETGALKVLINANGVQQPANSAWFFGLLDAGLPDDSTTSTANWLSQLVTATVVSSVVNSPLMDTVTFLLPQGFGPSRELLVVVGGVPSNILLFTYAPPYISNLAPTTVGAPLNMVILTIEGVNFCASTSCGTVSVSVNNNQTFSPSFYSDSKIILTVPDPSGVNSYVSVTVGGVQSNTVSFSAPVPSYNPASQAQWVNLPAAGGSPFYVTSVSALAQVHASLISVYLGPFLCNNVNTVLDQSTALLAFVNQTFKVTCTTPPGVGANLAVRIATLGGTSASTNFIVSYASPVISAIVDGSGLTSFAPQSFGGGFLTAGTPPGSLVRAQGLNFGTPALVQLLCGYLAAPSTLPPFSSCTAAAVAAWSPSLVSLTVTDFAAVRFADATPSVGSQSDSSVSFAMPAGQGTNISVTLSVGWQTGVTVVRYALPVVVVNEGVVLGDNAGGSAIFISGSNFGNALASSNASQGLPIVFFGPFGPAQILALQTASMSVLLPVGWGANLPVTVTVEGQTSNVTSSSLYSYAAPKVLYVLPQLPQVDPIFGAMIAGGPTSGLTGPSTPQTTTLQSSGILMTIVGTNLGNFSLNSTITLVPTAWSSPGALPIVVPPANILDPSLPPQPSNFSMIQFYMPEGAGSYLRVVVTASNQDSTNGAAVPPAGEIFSYLPPIVQSIGISSQNNAFLSCAPVTSLEPVAGLGVNASSAAFSFGFRIETLPGTCFPCDGNNGVTLWILGVSFGAQTSTVTVSIGNATCSNVQHDQTWITCTLPNGMGTQLPVFVTAGGRSNTIPFTFSYDPPVVNSLSPSPSNALVGNPVSILGSNFGPWASPATVLIGGLPCMGATWQNDGKLTCTTLPDVVGSKNISVLVANRSQPVFYYEQDGGSPAYPTERLELRCPPNSMGIRGEFCTKCQGYDPANPTTVGVQGALCPGGELDTDMATALPGWWRYNTTSASQCQPNQVGRALNPTTNPNVTDPGCPVFIPCLPAAACLGNNLCAGAYVGYECNTCADGFYKVIGACIACPSSPWATVIVFLVLAILAMSCAYVLNAKNINLSLISIGTDWAQIVAMFARTPIAWPDLVEKLFSVLSAFNFNLDLVAPECAIHSVTYSGKWLFVEGMPIFAWLWLAALYIVQLCFKALVMGREKKDLHTHVYGLVATAVVVQRVLYLYLTRNTLDVFNCSSTTPPSYDSSGNEILYMAYQSSIVCGQAGGTQLFLLPFAAFGLAIYVIGVPLASLFWLTKNKEKVKYDQILRAQLTGDDKSTNPHFAFRSTWKALYMNYRPGSWFWEFVICVRKFLIAFCSLMFRATPSFQLAMALLVLFIAYVAQVRTLPYLSHARAVETAREHKIKVAEGNAMHVRINEDMLARAAYYKRASTNKKLATKGGPQPVGRGGHVSAGGGGGAGGGSFDDLESFYTSRRSTFENQVLEGRHTILRNRVASFMFDYNTAEAVLLASAILINLAGICFTSSRFASCNPNGDSALNPNLTPEVLSEYNSLAYAVLTIMFLSIIYWFTALGMDVLLVTAPQSVASCLSTVGKAGKTALANARRAAGGRGAQVSKGPSADGDELADPNAVVMNTNAAMVLSLQRGGGAGGSGGAGAAGISDDGILAMRAPPDPLTWPAVRDAYAAATTKVRKQQAEIERLRAQVEDAGAAGGGSGGGASASAAGGPKGRKAAFGPTTSGGAAPVAARAGSTRSAASLKSLRTTSAPAAAADGGADDAL